MRFSLKTACKMYAETPTDLPYDSGFRKLVGAIAAEQRSCSARLVTAKDVVKCLVDVEKELGISKAALADTMIRLDINAQEFPNHYLSKCRHSTPQSTQVWAEYKVGGWTVTNIRRADVQRHRVRLTLSETAKAALIERFSILW